MIRIKRGNISKNWKKKYLKLAKGYAKVNSKLSTFAVEQIIQSLNFSYKSRKLKKRFFRTFWISRISILINLKNKKYSFFIGKLRKNNIFLNRKILSYLAFYEFNIFYLLNFIIKANNEN